MSFSIFVSAASYDSSRFQFVEAFKTFLTPLKGWFEGFDALSMFISHELKRLGLK